MQSELSKRDPIKLDVTGGAKSEAGQRSARIRPTERKRDGELVNAEVPHAHSDEIDSDSAARASVGGAQNEREIGA